MKTTLQQFRKNFEFVKKGIFFDSSAISLIPNEVIEKTSKIIKNFPVSSYRSVYSYEIEKYIENTRNNILKFFLEKEKIKEFETFFGQNASDIFSKVILFYIEKTICKKDIIVVSKHSHHTLTGGAAYLKKSCKIVWLEEISFIKDLKNVKFVFLQHISNITGDILVESLNKYKKIFPNAKFVLDISQSFGLINKDLFSSFDILFFSAHKYLSYTGLGVLLIKKDIFKDISFPSGGNIFSIKNDFSIIKSRNTFELGTLNSISIIAFYFALEFIEKFHSLDIKNHLLFLNNYFCDKINENKSNKFHFLGNKKNKKPIFSIFSEKFHSHDLSDFFFNNNIFVRSGFQCCSTCLKQDVTRISLFPYNTHKEIDDFFIVLNSL